MTNKLQFDTDISANITDDKDIVTKKYMDDNTASVT